jgi:post-segregation antitoxin (ccd killing protein)
MKQRIMKHPKREKTAICLKIDPRLADQARLVFAGQMSRLFEAAIKDALAIKQQPADK